MYMAKGKIVGNAGDVTDGDLYTLAGVPASVDYSIAAEAANAIAVTASIKDGEGNALANKVNVWFYLSTDAEGDNIAATAPTGGVAFTGTDVFGAEAIADKLALVGTTSTGTFVATLTDTGTPTFYAVTVLPNGKRDVSAAITFA